MKYSNFNPDLGTYCHMQRQGDFSAAAVSDLEGNILFTSRPASSGPTWAVTKLRVMVTRFWSASSFYGVLELHKPQPGQFPPPLPLAKHKLVGNRYGKRAFGPETGICIYFGYIDSPRPVQDGDLHGENASLYRVFVGSVDTLSYVDSKDGITVSIQGRDRMKWLMDTSVTYNAITDGGGDRILQPSDLDRTSQTVARSDIIREIAQRGIGHVVSNRGGKDGVCGGCGRSILRGDVKDIESLRQKLKENPSAKSLKQFMEEEGFDPTFLNYEPAGTKRGNVTKMNPEARDVIRRSTKNPAVGIQHYLNNSSNLDDHPVPRYDPYFHAFVTRPGVSESDSSLGAPGITVADQAPIDYIKHLAQHEIYPTEFFQDNVDGDFYYVARVTRPDGLYDPRRFYRTYFTNFDWQMAEATGLFKDHRQLGYIQEKGIDPRQQVETFKEEISSLTLRTNYIVTNGGGNTQDPVAVHFKVKPYMLRDKAVACKTKLITDELITGTPSAGAIAAAFARIYGRELRAGMMVVQGDPTLQPSEGVQVVGHFFDDSYMQVGQGGEIDPDDPEAPHTRALGYAALIEQDRASFLAVEEERRELVKDLTDQVAMGYNLQTVEEASPGPQSGTQEKPVNKAEVEKARKKTEMPVTSYATNETDDGADTRTAQFKPAHGEATSSQYYCGKDGGDPSTVSYLKPTKGMAETGADASYFTRSPTSTYRVEALIHKFNDGQDGYYTEVALIDPL